MRNTIASFISRANSLVTIARPFDEKLDPSLRHRVFAASVALATEKAAAVESTRRAYQNALRERDDQLKLLREDVDRLHAGVRSAYGPNSREYASLGLVRKVDRKRPTPRVRAASASPAPDELLTTRTGTNG